MIAGPSEASWHEEELPPNSVGRGARARLGAQQQQAAGGMDGR